MGGSPSRTCTRRGARAPWRKRAAPGALPYVSAEGAGRSAFRGATPSVLRLARTVRTLPSRVRRPLRSALSAGRRCAAAQRPREGGAGGCASALQAMALRVLSRFRARFAPFPLSLRVKGFLRRERGQGGRWPRNRDKRAKAHSRRWRADDQAPAPATQGARLQRALRSDPPPAARRGDPGTLPSASTAGCATANGASGSWVKCDSGRTRGRVGTA